MFNMYNYPLTVLNQYQEYLKLIDYYKNSKTNSIPIKYFNIDIDNSVYDEDALMTYDKFNNNVTGVKYNVYEFTPAFYTSPILNQTTFEQDKDFTRFQSIINIQIYTIPKVYIGDLVQFYNPNDQEQVLYRVTNFRVPLNNYKDFPVFELDLEPAPIKTFYQNNQLYANININNVYIYDYSREEYIPMDEYQLKLNIVNIINTQYKPYLLSKLTNNELITTIYNDVSYTFYEINYWLYTSIGSYNKKFKSLDISIPFGILDVSIDYTTPYTSYEDLLTSDTQLYDLNTNTLIPISQLSIDTDQIDTDISSNTFDINNFAGDLEKQIILLYLIQKLNT